MIVVSDTTALSNLIQIGETHILKEIYQKILIPESVYDELLVLEEFKISIKAFLNSDWIEVRAISSLALLEEFSKILDKGEAEAIILAMETKADFLLIDEKKGRMIASEYRLPIIGTLGILLEAKKLGLIDSVTEKMDALREIGFWISDDLYEKIALIEKKA